MSSHIGSSRHYLHNGTAVPEGQLEAVGQLVADGRMCTATLITDRLVLSAAHCVCADSSPNNCSARATFTFQNVVPAGGGARRNVSVQGDVRVHPDFGAGDQWLLNDFSLVELDTPAHELVDSIVPIPVESPANRPEVGDSLTLVGFGLTGDDCMAPSAGKRITTVSVDSVSDITIRFNDEDTFVCPGDSGGPALNRDGRIVGVSSSGNFAGNSNYDPTYVAHEWIFPGTPAPVIAVPASLSFGKVPQRDTRLRTLRISNVGTAPLSLSVARSTPPPAGQPLSGFSWNAENTSVPSGGSLDISIRFSPRAEGLFRTSLRISHNASGTPRTIILSGEGLPRDVQPF